MRLSILSPMLLVLLGALVPWLSRRLGGEADFFIPGPILRAMLVAPTERRDRFALGEVAGGPPVSMPVDVYISRFYKCEPGRVRRVFDDAPYLGVSSTPAGSRTGLAESLRPLIKL